MYRKTFLILCLSAACRAQVPFLGGCPSILPKQNFDITSYLGTWYELEKYFAVFQNGGKCISSTYSSLSPGDINVYNQQTNIYTNAVSLLEGRVRSVGEPNEGRLNIVYPWTVQYPYPFSIIETDYNSYSIVYSCVSFFFYHHRYVWVLTRARLPTPDIVQKAHSVMDEHRIPRIFLTKTDQNNCPN